MRRENALEGGVGCAVAFAGFLLGGMQSLFAFLALGGGHGDGTAFLISSAPLGLLAETGEVWIVVSLFAPPFIWSAFFIMAFGADSRWTFPIAVGVHYVGVLASLTQLQTESMGKVEDVLRIWLMIYAFCHVACWAGWSMRRFGWLTR